MIWFTLKRSSSNRVNFYCYQLLTKNYKYANIFLLAPKKNGGQKEGWPWTMATRSISSACTGCVWITVRSGKTSVMNGASPIQESSARRPTGLLAVAADRWRGTRRCGQGDARSAGDRKITTRTSTSHYACVAAAPSTWRRSTSTRGRSTGVVREISQPHFFYFGTLIDPAPKRELLNSLPA